MYKVGDLIRVKETYPSDVKAGIKKEFAYKVVFAYPTNSVEVKDKYNSNYYLSFMQIEKVEESKEMTFPEMVQKLIDGEFEVGTELVCDDNSYFVGTTADGYGLKKKENTAVVIVEIGASKMNRNWAIKEQPIKEMSIEELQKELGYKIKIVERESN